MSTQKNSWPDHKCSRICCLRENLIVVISKPKIKRKNGNQKFHQWYNIGCYVVQRCIIGLSFTKDKDKERKFPLLLNDSSSFLTTANPIALVHMFTMVYKWFTHVPFDLGFLGVCVCFLVFHRMDNIESTETRREHCTFWFKQLSSMADELLYFRVKYECTLQQYTCYAYIPWRRFVLKLY